jgi:hypothetical protein
VVKITDLIPDSHITTNNNTGKEADMGRCMKMEGKPVNGSSIMASHFVSGVSGVGVKALSVWGWLVGAVGRQQPL